MNLKLEQQKFSKMKERQIEKKTINLIIKKVQQIPNIKNHGENYTKAHHGQSTLKRHKEKKIFKRTREKKKTLVQSNKGENENRILIINNASRRQWSNIFKILKEKHVNSTFQALWDCPPPPRDIRHPSLGNICRLKQYQHGPVGKQGKPQMLRKLNCH